MDSVKIVVQHADGRIINGYVHDFFPQKLSFHMYPYDPQGSQKAIEILVKELRAVYFVQDFVEDLKFKEEQEFPDGVKPSGRKVEVTFKDGEVMIGCTLGYDPQRLGFFLFPSNPHCNILRVFVVSEAVSKVHYI
jgi:hypothetical protein